MKHSPLCLSRHQIAMLAAALGLSLLAAPVAHAFTLEGQSDTSSGGSAKYTDPADPKSRLDSSGTTLRQGNATFQFGPMQSESNDARFNADAARMFNPLGRPGQPDR
jgi:hypothetical protein